MPPAQNMKLKETVCLSLQGPKPLPDIFNPLERPAFHWGDDINFDSDSYRLNFDGQCVSIIMRTMTTTGHS
jgi:hypothetical protein